MKNLLNLGFLIDKKDVEAFIFKTQFGYLFLLDDPIKFICDNGNDKNNPMSFLYKNEYEIKLNESLNDKNIINDKKYLNDFINISSETKNNYNLKYYISHGDNISGFICENNVLGKEFIFLKRKIDLISTIGIIDREKEIIVNTIDIASLLSVLI